MNEREIIEQEFDNDFLEEQVAAISFAGMIDSLSTVKDKGLKLVIRTGELNKNVAAELLENAKNQTFLNVLAAPTGETYKDIYGETYEDAKKSGKLPKTMTSHSQRLRSVLYLVWKTNPVLFKKYVKFESYYDYMMNTVIEHFKKKIIESESDAAPIMQKVS